jgi:hypothetical protein
MAYIYVDAETYLYKRLTEFIRFPFADCSLFSDPIGIKILEHRTVGHAVA